MEKWGGQKGGVAKRGWVDLPSLSHEFGNASYVAIQNMWDHEYCRWRLLMYSMGATRGLFHPERTRYGATQHSQNQSLFPKKHIPFVLVFDSSRVRKKAAFAPLLIDFLSPPSVTVSLGTMPLTLVLIKFFTKRLGCKLASYAETIDYGDASEGPVSLPTSKATDIFDMPNIESRLDRYKLDPRLFIKHPEFLESTGELMAQGTPLRPEYSSYQDSIFISQLYCLHLLQRI
ncbi:hypothetical protein CCUS01_03934 [Colletotrichum cuscutae]|uniref:Uncharacterized protein n=1 Tax=Colletotrichum cuscutae TaxID=1209917 RepID=A0AAI9VI36_9PEZI|nr:hypothetical protein CCUS01_03934 [Colletotrichum cuscutae]